MKLVTFQSREALEFLNRNGYLICDEKYINKKKVGDTYNWIIDKMKEISDNKYKAKYPLWSWVKCYNNICPPKRKGDKVKGFDVKIIFEKDEENVFITDFRRYSFLLNNTYIPISKKDKEEFDKQLSKYNITEDDLKAYVRHDKYDNHRTDKEFLEVCKRINDSFDKCITTDSNILQGCVWYIDINEIKSIEILNDDGYSYGTINYIRSNGQRKNWREDYYKKLK